MVEEYAQASASRPGRALVDILGDISSNKAIRKALNYEHIDKIAQGILPHAKEDFIRLVSQYRVHPDELEVKTAELLNAFSKPHSTRRKNYLTPSSIHHLSRAAPRQRNPDRLLPDAHRHGFIVRTRSNADVVDLPPEQSAHSGVARSSSVDGLHRSRCP